MRMALAVTDFWTVVEQATDPTAYKPHRKDGIIVSRLEGQGEPYYILKEPLTKSYLRLSEADYAIWWQMNGRSSVKDLLFYSLLRYQSLPIGRLNRLIDDLRNGHFLQDQSVHMYSQIELELEAREPASRGRRILDAFLHTEVSITGLDDFFTPLYQRLKQLFILPVQMLLLMAIVIGGGLLFGRLFWLEKFALSGSGGLSLFGLFAANIIIIGIHELAHGLATKQFDRELNRGGFLLYWGMPAFFVDTRDIWLSPRFARIIVSWAGPHSGLIIGGLAGWALTAITSFYSDFVSTFWAGFIYQLGFLAYLSVFINMNPLLELDAYFILIDWLEMPGLRQRAFIFWKEKLWGKIRNNKNPRQFWSTLRRSERIFTFYGGLSIIYSVYALGFAVYFWQTRLFPFTERLWTEYGFMGRLLVLLVTALVVLPAVYYLFSYGWDRIEAGLEWLARRDLLARPDVLTFLIGLILLVGSPLIIIGISSLPNPDLWLNLATWLLHIAAIIILIFVALQLPGSRFQWAIWALVIVPASMTLVWMSEAVLWRDLGLIIAAGSILASGTVSWFTIWPKSLERNDRLLMGIMLILSIVYGTFLYLLNDGFLISTILIILGAGFGLILMSPLWLNFWYSRFALPWFLLVIAILSLPLLQFFPSLHLPVLILWLYAGMLYLLLGALAQFSRRTFDSGQTAIFQERERLVNSFNHFMQALFTNYELVFGGRRLAIIQMQMIALGPIDPDGAILQIADRCRQAILLAVDRLDDLAGTPFTRKAGQAAYDSLPWLEAETLARNVLSKTEWGSELAQGFIKSQDSRVELIRQADIFAGFNQNDVEEVSNIATFLENRAGRIIARGGQDATRFFLIESGEVGVFHQGIQMASLKHGGYFGTNALLNSGNYQFTYRSMTPVRVMVIDRNKFDPLLRNNTTLSGKVNSGAKTRQLLKKMPLFSSLSPQQLATIDRQLQYQTVKKGTMIVRQGQTRSHLFIIADGQVEVLLENEDRAEVVGELGPGEHFGEYALFADTPYNASYRAVVDTTLMLLDEPKFDRLVAECDVMSHYVEQIGSGRLISTRRRLGPSAVIS